MISKNRVIDRAIKDVEQNTPFRITYTQKKKGRIVAELVFSFEDTATKGLEDKKKKGNGVERDPNTIDWVNGQTRQRNQKKPHHGKLKACRMHKLKSYLCIQKILLMPITVKFPRLTAEYPEIFESWRPHVKRPKTGNHLS